MAGKNRVSRTPDKELCKVPPSEDLDPELEALVREIIGRVADKWTMLALEVLEEHGSSFLRRLDVG